jgi:hypothetical protein
MNAAPKEISDGKNNKSCPPWKTEKYAKHERYKKKHDYGARPVVPVFGFNFHLSFLSAGGEEVVLC